MSSKHEFWKDEIIFGDDIICSQNYNKITINRCVSIGQKSYNRLKSLTYDFPWTVDIIVTWNEKKNTL